MDTKEKVLAVTPRECHIYAYLFVHREFSTRATPPLAKADICRELDITKPTLDKALKHLAKLEFIYLLPHPKRKLVVSFTPPFEVVYEDAAEPRDPL